VPQRDKWRPERQGEFFYDHVAMSRHDAAGREDNLAGITHVIWPEASMPFRPLDSAEALSALGSLIPHGVSLIAGALRYGLPIGAGSDARPAPFNSIMVFGQGGKLAGLYDKIHLVPFGEYLPFQPTLEAIGLEQLTRVRGGFAIGNSPRPLLRVAGLPPLAPLICYESVFPAAVVQGDERPGAILNVTNDGWFGHTTGPYQHFHMARVRAVEEGLPVIRSANNGFSAVIDGHGRVLARLRLDERGVIDSPLPTAVPTPFYARHGDAAFWLLLSAAVFVLGGMQFGRRT
jgi:apolipoprotein N-acyltransferase